MMSLRLLAVSVVLVYGSLSVTQASPGYSRIPGDVHIRRGDSITLEWTHDVPPDQAGVCYWEYDDLDPIQMPQTLLSVVDGQKITPGEDIAGWSVIDKKRPCYSPITKPNADEADAGYYKMAVGRLHSPMSTVNVYNVPTLNYSIDFGGRMLNFSAADSLRTLAAVTVEEDVMVSVTVQLSNNFPPITNISIEQNTGSVLANRLQCNLTRTCKADLTVDSHTNITLVVSIDTGIRGYPVIEVEKPYENNGISVGSAGGHVTVVVLVMMLALVSVALLVILLYHFKERIKPPHKGLCAGDDRDVSYGIAMAYCHNYLINVLSKVKQTLDDRKEQGVKVYPKLIILIPPHGKPMEIKKQNSLLKPQEVKLLNSDVTMNVYNLQISLKESAYDVMIEQPRCLNTFSDNDVIGDVNEQKATIKQFRKHVVRTLDTFDEVSNLYQIHSCADKKDLDLSDLLPEILKKGNKAEMEDKISRESKAAYGLAVSHCCPYLSTFIPVFQKEIARVNMQDIKLILLIPETCQVVSMTGNQFLENTDMTLKIEITPGNQRQIEVMILNNPNDERREQRRYVVFDFPRAIETLYKISVTKEKSVLKRAAEEFKNEMDKLLKKMPECRDRYILVNIPDDATERKIAEQIWNAIITDPKGTAQQRDLVVQFESDPLVHK